MFIAALFTIAQKWNKPKYPSADKWINKMWSAHTMESYAVISSTDVCANMDQP